MNKTEVLAELRGVLDDTVQPYAWSDTRLKRFLAKGQDQFCQDTGFFKDSTTFTITTATGVDTYPIPARVIQVNDIWYGDTKLRRFQQGERVAGSPETPAVPYAWQADQSTGFLQLYPAPAASYTLQLQVWRKSLQPFGTAEMEIPEDFHFAPVEYAAYMALNDHDRERQDPVKARDHLLNYKTLATDGKRAWRRLCSGPAVFKPNSLYIV
jgi:hypothetical protein